MKGARRVLTFITVGGLLTGIVFLSLMVGAWPLGMKATLTALGSPQADSLAGSIVWEIRLPRVALALLVGAMLSVAGAIFQVLLRNPLADPYVLGISGGAAVGGIGALLVAGTWGGWSLSLGALLGALLTVAVVFVLAGGWRGAGGDRLLLTGVVMASFWGACVTLFLSMSQDDRLRSVLFWLLGDLGQVPWLWGAGGVCVLGVLAAWMLGRSMNALAFGDRHAWSLGVSVRPVRLALYGVGSLLTAVAVSSAGAIGFVGLIVPHTVRLLGCQDYRMLVPLAALLGGAFLVAADTVARTVAAPVELPVGVVTAFVGVPFFLWLLRRGRVR